MPPKICRSSYHSRPRSRYSLLVALLSTLLASCATQNNDAPVPASNSSAEALAQKYLVIDTHVDVPYRIKRNYQDVGLPTDSGEFYFPRATKGGLNAPFMSIYIPAAVDEAGGAFAFAEDAIDSMVQLSTSHPDKFALATCTDDLLKHQQEGLISLPLGMENGGKIFFKISNLERFYKHDMHYVTLAHTKRNHISDSSYDTNEAWQGWSEFGKTLHLWRAVEACSRKQGTDILCSAG